jgi:hypothetical protein
MIYFPVSSLSLFIYMKRERSNWSRCEETITHILYDTANMICFPVSSLSLYIYEEREREREKRKF